MASLQAQTFDGLPGGMNVAMPQHSLEDTEARYLQDVLLDFPGLVRRRGPVRAASGFPTFTHKGCGITGTINPAGSYILAILNGDADEGYIQYLSDDYSSAAQVNWGAILGQSPYPIFDAKPALNGGVYIATSSQYSAGADQLGGFWRGGNKVDYNTGTISITRGGTAVTGVGTSWSTNVAPGMFLFSNSFDSTNTGRFENTFIGVVKSVQSNTALTLEDPCPYTVTTMNYKVTSFRGLQFKVMKGRLTTSTSSTTVTGSNTKFLSQYMDEVQSAQTGTTSGASPVVTALANTAVLKVGMRMSGTNIAAGSFISTIDSATQVTMNQNSASAGTNNIDFKHAWNLYRASDKVWIGRVTLVNNEISITIAANATQALNNEKFFALCGTGNWSSVITGNPRKLGVLNAFYAGRQWYANNGEKLKTTSRVWFSEVGDPEGLDLAEFDGDFFDISSSIGTDTSIKAIVPAYNALVAVKENETYAITGSTPTTFSIKKIQDDGALSGMSAQPYAGGVIWAGVEGIYFYDGITVINLSDDKLGDYYKNAVRNMNPDNFRMWGMVIRGHYMLHIENFAPSVGVIKGSLSYTPTATTIVINMATKAYSLFTNLSFRGYVETPADTGKQNLYLVNDASKAVIGQGFDMFDATGQDTTLCDLGASASLFRYGETALGSATSFNGVADKKYFSKVTIGARCAIQTISVYTEGQGGGSTTGVVVAGLYSDNAGNPDALLGATGLFLHSQDEGPAFRTYTFSTPVEVAPGDYWIGVHVDDSGITKFFKGSTADTLAEADDTYGDGLEDPFGAHTDTTGPLVAFATVLTTGPDFYVESKKFTEGDSMHKKLFKQLSLTYIAQGDSLRLDTVPGLQNIGRTSTAVYPTTVYTWDQLVTLAGTWDNLLLLFPTWASLVLANFKPKRIKFLKRNQMLSFRIWQNSPAVTNAHLGPFQLLYKWQRLGRI